MDDLNINVSLSNPKLHVLGLVNNNFEQFKRIAANYKSHLAYKVNSLWATLKDRVTLKKMFQIRVTQLLLSG